jgi:hypothetical protein
VAEREKIGALWRGPALAVAGRRLAAQPNGLTNQTTGEASTAIGLYNMPQGDVPSFKQLADTCHGRYLPPAAQGGTGAGSLDFTTRDVGEFVSPATSWHTSIMA